MKAIFLPAALGLAVVMGGCSSSAERARAKADQELTRTTQAEKEFAAGMNRAPTAKTLYAMARILSIQHRDADCRSVLSVIIHDHPEYLPAYNELAELQLRQRRVDEAVATIEQGLKLAPRSPVLINNRGMCHLLRNELDEALADFMLAAAIRPDDTRYRANMAVALGLSGRYDESLALYEQVATPQEAHYNLAVLAQSRKDDERAEQEFGRARDLAAQEQKDQHRHTQASDQ